MRGWESDLVVLVPDKSIEAAILGILSRPEALGIRSVESKVFVHPDRDPGCLLRAHEFLRSMTARFAYGLVLFDRDGCGREGQDREALEEEVTRKLAAAGWDDRAAVIVIDPELEV
jgi:hypothetical protein